MSLFASEHHAWHLTWHLSATDESDIKDLIKIDEQWLVGKRRSRTRLHDSIAVCLLNMSVSIPMMLVKCQEQPPELKH
jgi:hypothetical protein